MPVRRDEPYRLIFGNESRHELYERIRRTEIPRVDSDHDKTLLVLKMWTLCPLEIINLLLSASIRTYGDVF